MSRWFKIAVVTLLYVHVGLDLAQHRRARYAACHVPPPSVYDSALMAALWPTFVVVSPLVITFRWALTCDELRDVITKREEATSRAARDK